MNWWPFGKRPEHEQALQALQGAQRDANRELHEVQGLHAEASRVGASLAQSHQQNHIAAALITVIASNRGVG